MDGRRQDRQGAIGNEPHLKPHSMGGGGVLMDREDKGESSDLVEQHDSG